MSSVAVATLARETLAGPDPYRRTLAQLSRSGGGGGPRGAGPRPGGGAPPPAPPARAAAPLAREPLAGPAPYRRTLAQLSRSGGAVAPRGAGLDPVVVLAVLALVTGATAVLRQGRVAVDARHAAAPALPQAPPVALGR